MNQNTKRLVLLNLPYVLMGLYATNLGYAWRLSVGADFSEKVMSLMSVLPGALGRIVPSFHPLDLAVGLCCGAGLRLAVYLKARTPRSTAMAANMVRLVGGRPKILSRMWPPSLRTTSS